MTFSDIAAIRLQNQKLLDEKLSDPEEIVNWLGAVQSQDYRGAKWALAQRCKNINSADIDKLFNDGKILRTHAIRPTWHFVLPEDIRWILGLASLRVKKLMAYYDRKLDIDQKLITKVGKLFASVMANGKYLTRTELEKVLAEAGITAHGQKLGHIVMHAELDQIICSGPMRGKQFTYALLTERAPKAKKLSHNEALAELAKRYFQSHGPALVADFAWWSGLTMADAGKGAKSAKLQSETIDGKTYWFTGSTKPPKLKSPLIQLLPNYDEYLISYKDYSPIFSGEVKKLNNQFGNALVAHILVKDGLVIGGWRRTFNKNTAVVTLDPLIKLSPADKVEIKIAAKEFSQFLGMPVSISID